MKILFTISLLFIYVSASFFSFSSLKTTDIKHESAKLKTIFLQNVQHANAIIKRGEYEKISLYNADKKTILEKINVLDISEYEKEELHQEMKEYFELVGLITTNMLKQAPNLNTHYKQTLKGLKQFNTRISSIGLFELSSRWIELSRIKNSFVKNPSNKLEKDFNDTYNALIVTITELYLDTEIEEPMFDYLREYKAYFDSIALAYTNVHYNNIAKLKPLSYKLKAKLELYVDYSS